MNALKIITGMPLAKGDPCVIRNGIAFRANEGETPTHVCTVDCSCNAQDAVEEIKK